MNMDPEVAEMEGTVEITAVQTERAGSAYFPERWPSWKDRKVPGECVRMSATVREIIRYDLAVFQYHVE